ncbi:hypothetical protein P879_08664 [Paragonimus westermani]|uniref:Uncharacterized protein n=1 Tax=Paragonimus westermani TaxID=34504 RepID=A0A8T0DN30_9TREM|nr:hypothetical protein P879_08664 [Paragonimus westermani]
MMMNPTFRISFHLPKFCQLSVQLQFQILPSTGYGTNSVVCL